MRNCRRCVWTSYVMLCYLTVCYVDSVQSYPHQLRCKEYKTSERYCGTA